MIIDEWALDEFETMNYFSKIKSIPITIDSHTRSCLLSYGINLLSLVDFDSLKENLFHIHELFCCFTNIDSNIFLTKYAIANK